MLEEGVFHIPFNQLRSNTGSIETPFLMIKFNIKFKSIRVNSDQFINSDPISDQFRCNTRSSFTTTHSLIAADIALSGPKGGRISQGRRAFVLQTTANGIE